MNNELIEYLISKNLNFEVIDEKHCKVNLSSIHSIIYDKVPVINPGNLIPHLSDKLYGLITVMFNAKFLFPSTSSMTCTEIVINEVSHKTCYLNLSRTFGYRVYRVSALNRANIDFAQYALKKVIEEHPYLTTV